MLSQLKPPMNVAVLKILYHMYANPPSCGRCLLSILTASDSTFICTGNVVSTWYVQLICHRAPESNSIPFFICYST